MHRGLVRGSLGNRSKHTYMKQLRWHADPNCPLGVSGRAKLLEEYDDEDRKHSNKNIQSLIDEIYQLAVKGNSYISKEDWVELFESHTGLQYEEISNRRNT